MGKSLETYNYSLQEKRLCILKRVVDVCVSLIVLIFIYPWAYLVIGILIKWKMPGKIIFTQWRTGKDGIPFLCYKFC